MTQVTAPLHGATGATAFRALYLLRADKRKSAVQSIRKSCVAVAGFEDEMAMQKNVGSSCILPTTTGLRRGS